MPAAPPPPPAPGSPSPNRGEDALAALEKMSGGRSPLKNRDPDSAIPPPTAAPLSDPRSPPRATPQPRTALPASASINPSADSADGRSASGFVSMLSKGGSGVGPSPLGPADSGLDMSRRDGSMTPARPQPQKVSPVGGANVPIRPAIEIPVEVLKPHIPSRRARPLPTWYQAAFPILITMGLLLMLISVWAVLGSIALLGNIRGIPFVPALEEDTPPDFWHYMPYIMLLCIPVAFCLLGAAFYIHRQIRAAALRNSSR